jgi:HAD superfamily hydrolase (TIGR01509 family)
VSEELWVSVAAVLFDFNGVIIDDEPLHAEAWRAVLTPLGVTFTDEEFYGPLLGVPDYEFFRLLLERRGMTNLALPYTELHAVKSALYDRLVRERPVDLPGLHDLVYDLAAHVPLGIVSGALRPEIFWHLARLRIADCFAAIVAAGEYERTKPDPAPFLAGLDALELATGRRFDPASVVAFEDSTNGLRSAQAAGMPVVGVTARIARERLPGCLAYVDDFAGLSYGVLVAWRDGATP